MKIKYDSHELEFEELNMEEEIAYDTIKYDINLDDTVELDIDKINNLGDNDE